MGRSLCGIGSLSDNRWDRRRPAKLHIIIQVTVMLIWGKIYFKFHQYFFFLKRTNEILIYQIPGENPTNVGTNDTPFHAHFGVFFLLGDRNM